jgi:hypothetical protein
MSNAKTAETSQYIDNYEHDDLFNAKQVTDVGSDKQNLIYIASSTLIYTGLGARGLATSADGWLLEKIDMSANPYVITHSIGVWDDRTTATYS